MAKVQKKYYRQHRHLLEDSLSTAVEVNSLDDIKRMEEQDVASWLKGYYKNVRISGEAIIDERLPCWWGNTEYHVVADFDGYTGQCIGWANFKE
jgi:hypothetical protein